MPSAKRALLRLSVALVAAAICVTASAAAAVPRGTLTATEYRQLAVATAALDQSASATSVNWQKARAACAKVSNTTALLRTQRSSCFGTVNVFDALASFPAEQRGCPKGGTTTSTTTTTATNTTGTTTTSATGTGTSTTGTSTTSTSSAEDSPVVRLLICMNPHYQALSRDAKAIEMAGIAARKQALSRGFTGACLTALAPTPAELRTANHFADATGKLAADVTLLIRVTEGKSPSSDFDQARISSDVKQFENSATAVLIEHGQPKLSVCPHQ